MTLLRTQLGNTLRGHRLSQRRTLRDVSGAARVSLGYLSEVERGQKKPARSSSPRSATPSTSSSPTSWPRSASSCAVADGGAVRPLAPSADAPAGETVSATEQPAAGATGDRAGARPGRCRAVDPFGRAPRRGRLARRLTRRDTPGGSLNERGAYCQTGVVLPSPTGPLVAWQGPVHHPGAHTRSGNAMGRTRLGLLAGAARAFAEHGLRRSTMQSIAVAAGVAKATLYNHFRTKDEVAAVLLGHRARPADRAGIRSAPRAGAGGALRRARCPSGAPPAGRDRAGGPGRAARGRSASDGRNWPGGWPRPFVWTPTPPSWRGGGCWASSCSRAGPRPATGTPPGWPSVLTAG